MSKGSLVCCVACLVAGPALGQQPAPLPNAGGVTTPSGIAYPRFRPEPEDSLPPTSPPVEGLAVLAQMPDPGPWYVTAEAAFLLRFTQGERPSRVAVLNGPAALGIGINLGGADRQGPPMPGGRVTLGAWSADCDPLPVTNVRLARWGGEVTGSYLGERSVAFAGTTAVPGLGVSNLAGRATFDIWGLEAIGGSNVFQNPPSQLVRIDLLGGFRYLNLSGELTAGRQTVFAPDLTNFPGFAPLAGNQITQVASYRARNQFYGGQVGLRTQFFAHGATFVSDFKLALGGNRQELDIAGQVQSTLPLPAALSGPFPADSGSFRRNKFSYIPQVDLALVIPLRSNLTARFGYSLLYWSGVVRAADQVETSGAFGNVEVFRDRGLFLHGLDAGLQLNF